MPVISSTFSELIVFLELCFFGPVRAVIKQETFPVVGEYEKCFFCGDRRFPINFLTKAYRY
jgi:hypothetical protein